MEDVDLLRYGLAFVFVVCLIGLMGAILRRMGGGSARTSRNRLRILETRPLDSRRRLVLVRRDDKEHLLLLADGRELVLEIGLPAKEDDEEEDE